MTMQSRYTEQIFTIPLWALIALALLIRPKPALDEADLARQNMILDDLYNLLPEPRNWLERALKQRVVDWIDREKGALIRMNLLGVRTVGRLEK